MVKKTLIVGSGVAATALANDLLSKDAKASIHILEAGGRVKTKDFGLWEHFLITGQLPYDGYKDLQYPQNDLSGENMSVGGTDMPLAGARVMTYGGSTIHWGGWSFRLKQEDFLLFSHTKDGADWPFDYAKLEPYYCKAEHFIGVSGDSTDAPLPRSRPLPFPAFPLTLQDKPLADALDALNIGYGGVPIARHGVTDTTSKQAPCQTTGTCKYCPFGARFAATNVLDDMRAWNDFPNLRVETEVIAESIVMDARGRARGVMVRRGKDREIIEADCIVIAAGTIESAKLLLRSQSPSWPNGLGNEYDQVGRYLITHPYFVFKGDLKRNPLRLQKEMDFPTLCTRHFDSTSEQAKGKFLLVNPPDTGDPRILAMMKEGKTRAEIDAAIEGKQTLAVHGMVEVFGRYKNRLSIGPGLQNRIGLEQTIIDFTKDDGFEGRIAEIQAHVAPIFAAMGATLSGKPSVSWRADHAASTCRMGTDPTSSVLDSDLRVHGVENVYVCSNAAFPNLGAVNPTLTLTALAFKLGDHLLPSQRGSGDEYS